jgi:hypothetical protein
MGDVFHSLMAKIDSISDKIPECVYVKICDDLKVLYRMMDIKPAITDSSETSATVTPANGYWLRQSQRRTDPIYARRNFRP